MNLELISYINLNVKNGNNSNFIYPYGNDRVANSFNASGNPLLRCIQVDDVSYSTTNWTNKNEIASYSQDCNNFIPPILPTTSIPDSNFERKLISLGYDSGGIDGVVYTAVIAAITSLNLSNTESTPDSEKISDLSGIEAFTALTTLNCDRNLLTSLDVSENIALTNLNCNSNQLTSLDVSTNTALRRLSLWGGNQLTSLDVSTNTALTDLDVGGNRLTSLNISRNTALTTLFCYSNQLTSLDLSTNTALINLSCPDNQLTSLDVSANTALTELHCNNNLLISLNVKNGNNSNFTLISWQDASEDAFKASSNPNLTCIQVDDVSYSTTNWTNKDEAAVYSENCSAPRIMSMTIDSTGLTITIQTNEPITITINVDNEDFTVTSTLNGVTTTHTVTNITSGSIILTVTPSIPAGADISMSYNPALGDNTEAITDNAGISMLPTDITLNNDDFKITSFSISPNPTDGILNITVNEKAEYKLLNIRGQTLKTGALAAGDSEINLSSLAKGIYLLNIKTSRGSFTEKVVRN